MATVSKGDIVLVVLDGEGNAGIERPAVVLEVNDATTGDVAVQVFTHGPADKDMYASGFVFLDSVTPDASASPEPHTWRARGQARAKTAMLEEGSGADARSR